VSRFGESSAVAMAGGRRVVHARPAARSRLGVPRSRSGRAGAGGGKGVGRIGARSVSAMLWTSGLLEEACHSYRTSAAQGEVGSLRRRRPVLTQVGEVRTVAPPL